ncbi:TRAP transporter large permease [Gimibacter soli]|uniref:TRAP transporter large permease protein n=1 Tax=Gimibacter soli TaxID=3024400 RepID=A0AAF0BN56_9PROT|nr:TRAP transporter large permease [Gimibacter soli]WCL55575.1 TRAP transporter large permease [Gimibacter soli]
MVALIIASVVALLLICGVAVAYVTGAGITLAYFLTDHAKYLAIAPQRMFASMDVFALMAMPLFIWAGELMNRTGITRSLVDFAMLLMGRFRGGLGHVNVATSVFFAGISGSAAADVAALSNTLVPQMERQGYDKTYAGAITAASSVIGPIIPPSIIMILYGAIMSTDVAALFAAGLVPGLLLALALIILNAWLAWKEGHPGGKKEDIPPFWPTLRLALPALSLPAIILGGIVFGVTTPIEAGALAVIAALVIGGTRRTISLGDFLTSLQRTLFLMGSIFVILAAGSLIAYLMALAQVPEAIAGAVQAADMTGYKYLILIMLVYVVMGMGIDLMVALAMVTPLLIPEAIAQGFHPVQLGVLVCLNLTIGLITPPMGGAIVMVSTITGSSYWALVRRLIPFMIAEFAVLILVMAFPDLTLALPRAMGLL